MNIYKSVLDLFEEMVTQHPTKKAIIYNSQFYTYQELNTLVNHLAYLLLVKGVKRNSLVGIHIERSLELIIAVLAIFKAGAVCVPLDVSYPEERLSFIIENSKLQFLLTEKEFFENKSPLRKTSIYYQLIFINSINTEEKIITSTSSFPILRLEDLAYVLYTSGSTGKPKGVSMPHKALANLINWQVKDIIKDKDIEIKVTQFSPISFDVSFQEISSTLCEGNTLVIVPEEARKDPIILLDIIITENISRIFLPTIALHQLAEMALIYQKFPTSLKQVITAGEQLQITPSIHSLFQNLPTTTLYNHYGPTETHVVTSHKLSPPCSLWPKLPPIGKPISNVQAYILNEDMQSVSFEDIGEIYIGGDCLADGYLNRPDLTKEKFMEYPSSLERVYKTGDLGRLLKDGTIEYIGRSDQQIKIRGYRIEISEIETVLSQHPYIGTCVIEARNDISGQKRLVAYIVPKEGAENLNNDSSKSFNSYPIKSFTYQLEPRWYGYLKDKLPDYMIPSTFVVLNNLPLTPSGKVDRQALPLPSTERPFLDSPLILPQTILELKLTTIWQEMLQLTKIGIHDSFFELGGHSLLLMQVHQKIIKDLAYNFPLIVLFQYPTIYSLAQYLEGMRDSNIPHSNAIETTKRGQDFLERSEKRRLARSKKGSSQ